MDDVTPRRRRAAAAKLEALGVERLASAVAAMALPGDPRADDLRRTLAEHARRRGMRPDTLYRRIAKAAKAKGYAARAGRYTRLLAGIATKERVLTGATLEEDAADLWKLSRHVEGLWDDAVLLYRRRRYPRAAALAVACIEELGRVAVARIQIFAYVMDRQRGRTIPPLPSAHPNRRELALYSHAKKHMLAAASGALVNSRLDRIVGLPKVVGFLDDVEAKRIESFRQRISGTESGWHMAAARRAHVA
jgi:AbiV family abortive infection protein